MSKPTQRTPSYCLHRASGQAVVRIDGKDHYLGKYDTPESRAEFDRLIAGWLGNGRCLPIASSAAGLTVNEVIAQELELDYTASIEGITIPAAWVRAAVGLDLPRSKHVAAGLDIGEEGPDLSVLVARAGPVVLPPVSWGRTLTTETAWRARDEGRRLGVQELNYDSGGVGSGVKSTWLTAEREARAAGRPSPLPFRVSPVEAGSSPTETAWPDGLTSKEKFVNLRAEMWWLLRVRFEKSYEFREKGLRHPAEEMISIPDDPDLIAQLSSVLHFRTESGKVQLESKKDMRKRGVKSPDFAEALALSFVPTAHAGTITGVPRAAPPPAHEILKPPPLGVVPRDGGNGWGPAFGIR